MSADPAPVRVLMISDVYFPRVNGVSTSIQTFRHDFPAHGCHCELIAPRYPAAAREEPGVHRVRSRYLPFDPEDRMMRGGEALALGRELAPGFDLIHIQTPFVAHRIGMRLARELGLPTVETYHTYFEAYFQHYLPLAPRSWLRALARRVSRTQCDAVDAVVSPSAQMAEVLRRYGIAAPIDVIPTGLDLERFASPDGARFRAEHGIDPARPVMLHVGRVAHEKNIGFLIDVVDRVRRRVPDVLFVIAGEGPATASLRRRVRDGGLDAHVSFVGYLDRQTTLIDCYAGADVFTFASSTETQGLVLLEAMAAGTPVVSTAVLGTKAVLEGARGAVVVDEDVDVFALAVADLLANPAARRALGDKAKEFVREHWSSMRLAERLVELYRSVLARPLTRPASDRPRP